MLQDMQGDRRRPLRARAALLTQDLSQLEQLIRQAAEQAGIERIENMLQVGFFTPPHARAARRGRGGRRARATSRARLARRGMSRRADRRAARADRAPAWRRCAAACAQFTERELQKQNHDYMEKFRRESAAREELLPPDRGRDPQDARGGRRGSPSGSRTCSRSAAAGSSAASSTCTQTLRRNMAHGGDPVRADLQAAQEGSPEARDPVRRVVARSRTCRASCSSSSTRSRRLHEDPRVRLRGGARRGDASSSRRTTSTRRSRRRSTAAT